MKSLTAVCQTGAPLPAIKPSGGRVTRPPHHRGDGENAEMKMYLSKLKDLVPFMPKNRKLSKLEIIQHVIDYICDLQSELETHPDIGGFDAASALNFAAAAAASSSVAAASGDDDHSDEELMADRLGVSEHPALLAQLVSSPPATRQPLVDRQAPNTILPPSANGSHAHHHQHHHGAAAALPLPLQQQQQQQQQQQEHLMPHTAAEKDNNNRQSPC